MSRLQAEYRSVRDADEAPEMPSCLPASARDRFGSGLGRDGRANTEDFQVLSGNRNSCPADGRHVTPVAPTAKPVIFTHEGGGDDRSPVYAALRMATEKDALARDLAENWIDAASMLPMDEDPSSWKWDADLEATIGLLLKGIDHAEVRQALTFSPVLAEVTVLDRSKYLDETLEEAQQDWRVERMMRALTKDRGINNGPNVSISEEQKTLRPVTRLSADPRNRGISDDFGR